MDNFSHAVAGLAVGEFLHRRLPPEADAIHDKIRRRLLLLVAVLASNFPDLDLVLTPLLPEPLGYLLHHRGHTHTFLYAIPQALLLGTLIWLLWPAARRLLRTSADARKGFGCALGAGLVLHILMDYLNSYGIHPFHPFDSRWVYGDMVFILEPVFWIAFGVPVFSTVRRLPVRLMLLGLLIGAPLYFTIKGFLAWPSFALLVAMAGVLVVLQRRAGPRGVQALLAAAGISVAFVGMQAVASTRAVQVVSDALLARDPSSQILDVAMTPFPAHPACWIFVAVTSNESESRYTLRRGLLTLAPSRINVSDCPPNLTDIKVHQSHSGAVAVGMEVQGDLATLRKLAQTNCHFSAWMRFARMPSVNPESATDVRFSSSGEENFTTLRFADFIKQACPAMVPQWDMPRRDLIMPPAKTSAGTK